MVNFLFAFLLEISETLKARISGTETDINKVQILSFSRSFILANNNIIKNFDALAI